MSRELEHLVGLAVTITCTAVALGLAAAWVVWVATGRQK